MSNSSTFGMSKPSDQNDNSPHTSLNFYGPFKQSILQRRARPVAIYSAISLAALLALSVVTTTFTASQFAMRSYALQPSSADGLSNVIAGKQISLGSHVGALLGATALNSGPAPS